MINEKQVSLVNMSVKDIEDILAISRENNLSSWLYEDYINELKRADSIQIVAKSDDVCVGFVVLRVIASSNEAEIYNLAVRTNRQRTGIGRKLIEQAMQQCQTKYIWLEVRESNQRAVGFYRKLHFHIVGRRKNFYAHPTEDAFIMRLELETEGHSNRLIY